jgi:hypothetical protein
MCFTFNVILIVEINADKFQIFQYAGVSGQNTSLLSSGAYGLVKLLFTVDFASFSSTYSAGASPCYQVSRSSYSPTYTWQCIWPVQELPTTTRHPTLP